MLATGDLFRRDEEGFLHWVGRTDDLIKCRGEKVYPREVEEVLQAVAGVQEAAVVGVPDRLLGQAVHAHVAALEGEDARPGGAAAAVRRARSRTTRCRSGSSSTRRWPGPHGARSTARR